MSEGEVRVKMSGNTIINHEGNGLILFDDSKAEITNCHFYGDDIKFWSFWKKPLLWIAVRIIRREFYKGRRKVEHAQEAIMVLSSSKGE